jgi:enoyl-CoA hydratase/carnithine racemase
VAVVQPARADQEHATVIGEMQAVRATVARDASQQAAPLQRVEQRDEIRLLDAERRARLRLQQPGIGVDHGQHREVCRAQVELGERVDEVLEDFELRAAQRVADVLDERSERTGDFGLEWFHAPLFAASGLDPGWSLWLYAIIMLPPSLGFSRDGDVGVLELRRPEKRNALDDATVLALERFATAPPDGIGALVLCAAGEHFSAGLDLNDVQSRDLAASVAHSRLWHRAFEALEFGALPVVAALQGATIGGGLELAAACHVRVAERSTFYALPEGQRGIFLGGGGSVRLPRLIGTARVMDMLLTGRVHDAEAGHAFGISQYLVDDGAGLAKALELAHRIAANAPISNFAIVQALPRIADAPAAIGYLTEALAAAAAATDGEAKRRVQAFLDKRVPRVTRV